MRDPGAPRPHQRPLTSHRALAHAITYVVHVVHEAEAQVVPPRTCAALGTYRVRWLLKAVELIRILISQLAGRRTFARNWRGIPATGCCMRHLACDGRLPGLERLPRRLALASR